MTQLSINPDLIAMHDCCVALQRRRLVVLRLLRGAGGDAREELESELDDIDSALRGFAFIVDSMEATA